MSDNTVLAAGVAAALVLTGYLTFSFRSARSTFMSATAAERGTPAADPHNLFSNASFERPGQTWSQLGGGTVSITSVHHGGSQGLALEPSPQGPQRPFGVILRTVAPDTHTPRRYRLSAWVRPGPATVGKRLTLELVELAGHQIEAFSTTRRLTRGWQRVTATGTAGGPDYTSIQAYLLVTNTIIAPDRVYLDDVDLTALPKGRR